MNAIEFVVNDFKYDLRLNTRNVVKLEKALGANPISLFMKIEDNELPQVEDVVLVLYYALQANHSGSFKNIDAVYDLYDEYVEGGGSLIDIVPVLIDLYKVSGLIPKDEEESEKNA